MSEIFETLGIEHYIILTDLINFNLMLKQIFPGEDFEHYNPLNTLKWDQRHKEWKKTKFYGETYEKKIFFFNMNFSNIFYHLFKERNILFKLYNLLKKWRFK